MPRSVVPAETLRGEKLIRALGLNSSDLVQHGSDCRTSAQAPPHNHSDGSDGSIEALCDAVLSARTDELRHDTLVGLSSLLGMELIARDTDEHRQRRDRACAAGIIKALASIISQGTPKVDSVD